MAKMTLVVPKDARGIVTIGTDPSRIRFILKRGGRYDGFICCRLE